MQYCNESNFVFIYLQNIPTVYLCDLVNFSSLHAKLINEARKEKGCDLHRLGNRFGFLMFTIVVVGVRSTIKLIVVVAGKK